LAAALAASSLLASGALHAAPISDVGNEPTNDTLANATMGVLGDTFTGCVGLNCDNSHTDRDVDFVHNAPRLVAGGADQQ
jgi:hypothetical protein